MPIDSRPLVAHVVYRFDTGGLENGVVNLINHMPAQAYRHAVIALTEVTDFRRRIHDDSVEFVSLHKPPGHGVWLYPRLLRLFRRMQPAIVHTRNLAALEVAVPAWLAGVPVRLHGEHGRDIEDLDGSSRRHQWMRRLYMPFVSHYFALSRDLRDYLVDKVHVAPQRVTQIYNGVDCERFHPGESLEPPVAGWPFQRQQHWVVGTVGRMQSVKDQTTLARAFIRAVELAPQLRPRLRLAMVGDGPLRGACAALLEAAGLAEMAWLPGARSDVAEVMRSLDCFALPSLAEGVSNTILEAMASGLVVLATRVGGNAELVADGRTGMLVAAADVDAMAQAIVELAGNPVQAAAMGEAGRDEVLRRFSLPAMVDAYRETYDRLLDPRASTKS